MHAALARLTLVRGARVEIVARLDRRTGTLTALADIAGGTLVAIVARRFVIGIFATGGGVAKIVGAHVPIIAALYLSADANPLFAMVCFGACIGVVAGGIGIDVDTAGFGVARVVCAVIAVVARQWSATDAGPSLASVADGAQVPIITRGVVV